MICVYILTLTRSLMKTQTSFIMRFNTPFVPSTVALVRSIAKYFLNSFQHESPKKNCEEWIVPAPRAIIRT